MVYRLDERELPTVAHTAEGGVRLDVGPRHVRLASAACSLIFADGTVTLINHKRRDSRVMWKLGGPVMVARDVPREDLSVWIDDGIGLRRVFAVAPANLLDDGGLNALRGLDALAQRLRHALREHGILVEAAIEVGRGLDKAALSLEEAELRLYVRPLFRDVAKVVLTAGPERGVTLYGGPTARALGCYSRWGVTVAGDYIRFTDLQGHNLGRLALPWLALEDRCELARRIGDAIHQGQTVVRIRHL